MRHLRMYILISLGVYEFLLFKMSSKQDERKRSLSLRSAVLKKHRLELHHLLATKSELDPCLQDRHGRTPLHYAVICPNSVIALKMVKTLLDCPRMKCDATRFGTRKTAGICDEEKIKTFVDIKDWNGETALHLAAKQWRQEIVEILIKCGADLSLVSNVKELNEQRSARSLVFANVPEAMERILNMRVTYKMDENAQTTRTKLFLDFRDIIDDPSQDSDSRSPTKPNPFFVETEALAKTFNESVCKYGNKNTNKIKLHPLIRIFVELKWKKLKWIIYLNMLVNMIILLLYNAYAYDLYVIKCPLNVTLENPNPDIFKESGRLRRSPDSYWDFYHFSEEHEHEQDYKDSNSGNPIPEIISCYGTTSKVLAILLIITAVLMAFIMLCQIIRFRKFIRAMAGTLLVNLLYILAALTTTIPLFGQTEFTHRHYCAAGLGVLISWALFLNQMRMIPFAGIGKYVEIFAKVTLKFVKLLITFAVIFFAFVLSIGIVMPKVPTFVLPNAFAKVIVMLTGEVNFDELFYDKDRVPDSFATGSQFIYTLFVVIVSLMLLNLLIGFTVSNVAILREAATVNQLLMKVQQMYFIESCLVKISKFLPCKKFFISNDPPERHQIYLEDIPPKFRFLMRKLAFKNTEKFDVMNIPSVGGVNWTKAKNGDIPDGAVKSGYAENGEDLYVARVQHGLNVIPGKIRKTHHFAYYAWDGQQLGTNKYEILTVANPDAVNWKTFSCNEEIPKCAIPGGFTDEGEILYVGQGQKNGAFGIGRVDYSDRILSIPHSGGELRCEEYEILVKNNN